MTYWQNMGIGAALLVATLSVAANASDAAHPTGLHVIRRIAGPDGMWDYASFDAARRRVYIAHENVVIAIDADTGKANTTFAQGAGLHSVVPVPGTDLIVTTNSGDNTAKVISAVDGKPLASIPTGDDPDGALYDPQSGLVIVICGGSGVLTLVDPKALKAVGTIAVGGHLEFGATDGKGRLFVNALDKNRTAVIDLVTRKVVKSYELPGCKQPTGLAYVAGDRLIAVCVNGGVDVLDARSGHNIASFNVGGVPDAVIYDEQRRLAFVPSMFTGTLSVISLSGQFDNTVVDTVPTENGARTGTVDEKTGRIYLPTAEYVLPAPKGKPPVAKPGTFKVLELDR
jgi:DNA-binding beta-propeller fold protein YncE